MSSKPQHPSGRPIRRPAKRDYSMQAHRYTGFRCPRLNEPPIARITQATDIHAVGFTDWRVGFLPEFEFTDKGNKR